MKVCQGALGIEPMALAAYDANDCIVGLLTSQRVQTLNAPLRISSRSVLYATPLVENSGVGRIALAKLLEQHDRQMMQTTVFAEMRPVVEVSDHQSVLLDADYEYYDYLNYVVDLETSEEELWSGLSKSCQKQIRKSRRRGVEIRVMNSVEGAQLLYRFLQASYRRSRVPLAHISLFESAIQHMAEQVRISIAFYQKRPVAGGILLAFKDRALAWYGGSERERGVSPFDLLTWEEMRWAREAGLRWYDFGGAGCPNEPYGPRDFKSKFGGALVNYGRYRKVYSPWRMGVAKLGYALGRQFVSPK